MFSCSENNETQPDFAKDYGRGLYIATDNGISFYDGDTLINNVFRNVNGITLSDVNKIKFSSNKIYILSDNQLNVANVNTLENLGEVRTISLALPERLQDLFVKMATTMASARAGDLDHVIAFMKGLIAEERYQDWLNMITDFHQALKKLPSEIEQPFKLVLSDSISEYFRELGFDLAQVYDEGTDQLAYPRFYEALEWKTAHSLTTHFKKRTQKDGMDLRTEADLVAAANSFLRGSEPNQIVFYRSDGTLVKYDSSTSELAIVSPEQTIITYYFVKYRPAEELAAYMKYVFREPPQRK